MGRPCRGPAHWFTCCRPQDLLPAAGGDNVGLLRPQMGDMARERHVLEACVAEMNTKGREVERWLAANEAKSPSGALPRRTLDCTAPAALRYSMQSISGPVTQRSRSRCRNLLCTCLDMRVQMATMRVQMATTMLSSLHQARSDPAAAKAQAAYMHVGDHLAHCRGHRPG
jgi:hypothetical protein